MRDDLLAVCATPDGRLWVGAGETGVAVFNGRRWTRVGTGTGLARSAVWGCSVDRAGAVWLGSGDGLFRAATGRVARVSLPGPNPSALVYSVFASSLNEVWVALDAGVFRLDPAGRSLGLAVSADEGIEQVLGEDSDRAIWMSGRKGLYRWRQGRLELRGRRPTEATARSACWRAERNAVVRDGGRGSRAVSGGTGHRVRPRLGLRRRHHRHHRR